MKKCPYCAEEIQDEAVKCRYCGEKLDGAPAAAGAEKPVAEEKPALIAYWQGFLGILGLGGLCIGIIVFAAESLMPEVPGMTALAAGLISACVLGFIFLDRTSRRYTVTSRRVIAKSGILSKNTDEVSISHIRSINVKQSLIGRVFNFGNIYIGTAGTEGVEVTILGISGPHRFKELIAAQASGKGWD